MENIERHSILLHALAEIRNQQIIQTKFNHETKSIYSDAYVYAIARSIYPYEDEQLGFEKDKNKILLYYPFYETYRVSYEQVKDVAELLDNKWLAKENITFYALENHYSRTWEGSTRVNLMNICRYLYLSNYFDKPFWKKFLQDSPSEANSLDKDFDVSELQQIGRILS